MKMTPIGISDIAIYLPKPCISLEAIVRKRENGKTDPRVAKTIRRAMEYTGQESMRFPDTWEDTVTMGAEAMAKLIRSNPDANLSGLRYIAVGTETTIDFSKPIAAYIEGLLQRAGFKIPQSISTYQIQHACAGGTISLVGVGAMLSMNNNNFNENGIVVCTDVAKYEPSTTAEITQGAGAVAMLVEKNPTLIELDLSTVGYSSRDVDDFFRPIGSDTAKVKGRFSLRCYIEGLEAALKDHSLRRKLDPKEVLESTDLFVLHVPYKSLPMEAMRHLLHKILGLSKQEATDFLDRRGFQALIQPASKSGNLYSGALFMPLAFLLKDRYKELGSDIIGKKVLLASYGSGNTMLVVSGKVAPKAPEVIEKWDLEGLLANGNEASFTDYEQWLSTDRFNRSTYLPLLQSAIPSVSSGSFYLNGIREDGYREYLFRE